MLRHPEYDQYDMKLPERFASRGEADFARQVLSAMRHAFGGHVEKPAPPGGTP